MFLGFLFLGKENNISSLPSLGTVGYLTYQTIIPICVLIFKEECLSKKNKERVLIDLGMHSLAQLILQGCVDRNCSFKNFSLLFLSNTLISSFSSILGFKIANKVFTELGDAENKRFITTSILFSFIIGGALICRYGTPKLLNMIFNK